MTITTTVPANPWALPTWTSGPGRPRRFFFTPTNLTRFNSNWTGVAYCAPVINFCINWQSNSYSTPVVNALYYLHTGTASYATTAYSQALAIPYVIPYPAFTMHAHPAALVLDWCYDALSPTQIANLVALIEGLLVSHWEADFTNNVSYHENFRRFMPFLMGAISIQGEAGTTDRNAKIRNTMQNLLLFWNEAMEHGLHTAYPYQEPYWYHFWVMYEIATGQTLPLDFFKRFCAISKKSRLFYHAIKIIRINNLKVILNRKLIN